MTRSLDDFIISCALTGSVHTPTLSEHLPITPEELIEQGVEAAEAGAAIIHVHVRDPETGEPTADTDLFREVASGIKEQTDAIVQLTTGGGMNQSVEERFSVVPALEPEMASFNMGSMNFGLYPITEAVDEFEYDWEREYLEGSRDFVIPNTFANLRDAAKMFDEAGTVPEFECYDVGHLYNLKHIYDRGFVEAPLHIQLVTGILGGIGAEARNITFMHETVDNLFGDDASWSVIGTGNKQMSLGVQAITMGGNARVGLEDNLYLERGQMAESNAEQVERIVDLAWKTAGREPASPDQVREFLGLKGQENVGF